MMSVHLFELAKGLMAVFLLAVLLVALVTAAVSIAAVLRRAWPGRSRARP